MANRPAISRKLQVEVFRRDGWLCCWCKRPVIFAPVMKFIEREIRSAGEGKQLAYYHERWTRDSAPLLDTLGAVIDHIDAFSTGGPSDKDNLATACNKCNARKGAVARSAWDARRKERPVKGKHGEPQHWDGLSTFFVLLTKDINSLTLTEKQWRDALVIP